MEMAHESTSSRLTVMGEHTPVNAPVYGRLTGIQPEWQWNRQPATKPLENGMGTGLKRHTLQRTGVRPIEYPSWLTEKGEIMEPEFCTEFLKKHPLLCINGKLHTVDGVVNDEGSLRSEIYNMISPWMKTKVANKSKELLKALRVVAWAESVEPDCDRIHVANGTYFVDGGFSTDKRFCRNRLSVDYRPDAPAPIRWLRFLSELLEAEDITTLQEYMGYVLLPTTRAQKMLMIIGNGGEGKSRIGVVLNSILGDSMNTSSIHKVEKDKFARADLENKLLMVDDDMKMDALSSTAHIKSIVTCEGKMDLERKSVQSYQGKLYVRFLCFGNSALTARNDDTMGFFRRQIILTTKDKPSDQEDDTSLAEKLVAEREGIFLWCLEGLHRLIRNHYRFTISDRARRNLDALIRDANNIPEFLGSDGYVCFEAEGIAATCDLYAAYRTWCKDNQEEALPGKKFSNYLAAKTGTYHLKATNNAYNGMGRRCRGYEGLTVVI